MDDNFDELEELQEQSGSESISSNGTSNIKKVTNAVGSAIETTGKNIDNVGKTVKSTGKTVEASGKGVEVAGKGVQLAGKGTQAAGKGAQFAGKSAKGLGKGAQATGQGINAAGDAAIEAGAAASATGAGAIAGIPLIVAGAAGKALGVGTDVAGKGLDVAGSGLDAAGQGLESAGKTSESAGKNIQTTGKNIQTTGKNIEKTGDKISDAGKKIKKVGKDVKGEKSDTPLPDSIKQALNLSEKTGKIADNARKAVETLSNPIKRVILISVVSLLLLIIVIAYILEPLTDAMNKIKTGADYVEKLNNFIHGLGFENSKDAFYDELDFLQEHYEQSINEPLLMATLFYDDVYNGKDIVSLENNISDTNDSNLYATTLMAMIDYAGKEGLTEQDINGIVYSANKIFRLKRLANNMVDKTGNYLNTVSFDEYVNINRSILNSDGNALLNSFISVLCCQILISLDVSTLVTQKVIDKLLPNYNGFLTTMMNSGYVSGHEGMDAILNFNANATYYIKDLIGFISDIKGVSIVLRINGNEVGTLTFGESEDNNSGVLDSISSTINSLTSSNITDFDVDFDINITYSQYDYDEEAYFNYLKNEYIPNMPEFKNIVYDKDGNVIDSKVNGIIDDIKMLASTWEEIYGDGDGTAEGNNLCIGDINTEILDKLSPPVQIETGTPITFTTKTAFGTTNFGKMHNGVDINEESAGVGVGTAVSSVYAGTVVASTASNDFSNDEKSGDGGWVKIEHTIPYTGDEGENLDAHIYTIYGGLDPTSIPTTGTTVSAGQQIGVIGDVIYSEDGVTPGLHFGFYDIAKIKFLNPLNVFIYCSEINGQNNGYGDMTINSSSCLKVHQISISLENFKKSVNAYIQRNSNPDAANYLRTWDLDEVYNEAVRNNINPELLVVRAIKEGFSPYNKDRSNYNYWGLGCYNGSGRCEHYSSMASGIAGFASARSVRSAESLEDMMSTYAYIGNNWYTRTQGAGNYWSDGGCPYFPYIRKYMPSGRAEEVSRYCENPFYVCANDSTPTCFPTIAVDQTAYTMYNIQGMNDDYVEIFGAYHDGRDKDCSNQVSAGDDITDYNPGKGTIFRVSKSCSGAIQPDMDGYPTNIMTGRLDSHTDIEQYNIAIKKSQSICSADGTRAEAVAVAVTTLNYVKTFNAKLPYVWGGGHGPTSDIGVNGAWQKGSYGLDCSGFVRWVLNTTFNAQVIPVTQAEAFDTITGARKVTLSSNEAVLKPGDLLVKGSSAESGHVAFIVKVDQARKKYITAEAVGTAYGIKYREYSFNETGYRGAALDELYGEKGTY